ncbi:MULTISPECIES: cytochrome B6 [unclassified Synechococcus]|nr:MULTISPECIES: cytochrome B6 [unclassified Synechococcus]
MDDFASIAMGIALYLGLVAGGLVTAFALTTVLRGIKLI